MRHRHIITMGYDLDAIVDRFLAPSTLVLPEGARKMPGADNTGVYIIDNTGQVLKAGSSVRLSETEAMRFVSRMTDVPVPDVHESYISRGKGYIFMDRVPGRPLSEIWEDLSQAHKDSLVNQLREIFKKLGSLRGDFFGALWNQPS